MLAAGGQSCVKFTVSRKRNVGMHPDFVNGWLRVFVFHILHVIKGYYYLESRISWLCNKECKTEP